MCGCRSRNGSRARCALPLHFPPDVYSGALFICSLPCLTERSGLIQHFLLQFELKRQEFVYLFAPLRHLLKEADLQNFRLENGLKIWPALWDYRHPNAVCFTAPVRPKKSKPQLNKPAPPTCRVASAHLNPNPVTLTCKDVIYNDVFIGTLSATNAQSNLDV